VTILSIGCKHKNRETCFNEFQTEYTIKSTTPGWVDNNVVINMKIYDSILAVVDNQNENILYFYDLKAKNHIGSIGSKGKGPNEFVNCPVLSKNYINQKKDIVFQIFDRDHQTFYDLQLYESLKSGILNMTKSATLPKKMYFSKPEKINDSLIVGVNVNSSLICFYNFNRDSLYTYKTGFNVKMLKQSIPEGVIADINNGLSTF